MRPTSTLSAAINLAFSHYKALRAQASAEGSTMVQLYRESQSNFRAGEMARAKHLAVQAKQHQNRMDELNERASYWVFHENNRDRVPGEINLHNLYVKEAIRYADMGIQQALDLGLTEVRLIAGRGLHSSDGAAKIKPAIEELMRKHSVVARLDPNNEGVLIVEMGHRRGRGVGAEDLSRRLERGGRGCVIM